MRIPAIAFAIASLAMAASAQPAGDVSETFHFTNAIGPQGMQEITNAVRTVLQLRQVSVQMDARTLTVQAAPSDLAMAQWLFLELDKPATPLLPSLQVDHNPDLTGAADQLSVFHLAHADSIQGYQEILNAVRVIPEITKVFPGMQAWSIAVRGSEEQLAMAEWLMRQFDQPAAPQGQPRGEQQFQTADSRMPELRVIYFAHAATPQAQQELVNALRTVPELTHVFPVMNRGAIAIRGPADRVALAEWLFTQLDRSGPEVTAKASAVHELTPGTDVSQVFFLPGSVTSQSFQEAVTTVRTATQSARVFPCGSSDALAFRGTPQQLAVAERILQATGK